MIAKNLAGGVAMTLLDEVRALLVRAGYTRRDRMYRAIVDAVDDADIEQGEDTWGQLMGACRADDLEEVQSVIGADLGWPCPVGVVCVPLDAANEYRDDPLAPCQLCADAGDESEGEHEQAHGPGLI